VSYFSLSFVHIYDTDSSLGTV